MDNNYVKVKISSFFIGLAISFSTFAQGPELADRMASARIIGGADADPNNWPFITYVKVGTESCGGSLIGDKYVLTAAHCVAEISVSDVNVYIGPNDRYDREPTKYEPARSYYIHSGYNVPKFANDIAIIELENTVTTPQITLATETEVNTLTTDSNLTVAGWGLTQEDGSSSNTLKEVTIPYVDKGTCQNIGGDYSNVGPYSLCAGKKNKDSCQGDSGGPLVIGEPGSYKQVGVVSWGDGCARKDKYGVYSNVGYFNTNGWIERNTSGVSHSPDILLKEKSGIYDDKIELRNLIPDDNFTHKLNVRSVELPQGVTLLNNNCSAELEYGEACTIDISIDASTVYANSDKATLKVLTDHQVSSELPISIVYSYEDRNATSYQSNNDSKDGGGSTSLAMMLLAMFGFGLRAKRQR
ncbi:serine protease [Vibrio aquimaris]|nr:serine protease [Vibrio aquimaris]